MKKVAFVLLCAVLLGGCINQNQACSRPYIPVGGSCCLDENGDGICDKDKPICKAPYLLVGNSCCLDEDNDGICDADKPSTTMPAPPAEATTPTTTAKTTTTHSSTSVTTLATGRACLRVEDCPRYNTTKCDDDGRVVENTYGPISCAKGVCIYKATTDIGATHCYPWEICVNNVGCVPKEQTTTTTLPTTPPITFPTSFQKIIDRVAEREDEIARSLTTTTTILPACVDPDGGKKYDVQSVNASGYFAYNHTIIYSASEYCIDATQLVEYYCETMPGSNDLKSIVTECGSRCLGGRCCAAEGRLCTGDDDCCMGGCRSIGMSSYCVE